MTIARVILQTLIFLSSADVTVNAPLEAGYASNSSAVTKKAL